jgi:hypothetical protein
MLVVPVTKEARRRAQAKPHYPEKGGMLARVRLTRAPTSNLGRRSRRGRSRTQSVQRECSQIMWVSTAFVLTLNAEALAI